MAVKILFAPPQPEAILDIARSLLPPGFELTVAEPGTPAFYQAAAEVELYLGLARRMGATPFRSAPKLRLVQLLSAGDRENPCRPVGGTCCGSGAMASIGSW